MNNPRRLGSLGSLPNGPLPNLIRARGEEAPQVQALSHGDDDLGQRRLGSQRLTFLLGFSLGWKPRQAFLE